MPEDWTNFLNIITPLTNTIISAVLGFLGGFLINRLKIKGDNINVKRERFLNNISKLEDYLSLLLDFSWLNADISKNEALLDSIELNTETFDKELATLTEVLVRTKIDIQNATNQSELNTLKKENEKLKLQIVEADRKSKYYRQMISEVKLEIDHIKSLLADYKKRLGDDDIGSTLNIIDPKNQISGYFKELLDISQDSKRQFYSDTRVLELKRKINTFINNQIMQIR